MQIVDIEIKDLHPYERNPRKNDSAVKYVAESIKQFGFKVPVVIDGNNVIVCGHTRYKAAKKLKLTSIPCVVADDLTEEQIKAYRLADNKVGELAEWDIDLLDGELSEILNIDMEPLGFEDLQDDGTEDTQKEREDLSGTVGEMYQVVIECADEIEQEEVFNKLSEEGYTCRSLTL